MSIELGVKTIKVTIENLGPFEWAEVEIRPLTVFIGRNSTGKSFLAQLLWSLMIASPDPDRLSDAINRLGGVELANKILDDVESGRNPEENLKQLIKLYIEAFPEAIASGICKTLQEVFLCDYRELIRVGSEKASILIEGPYASLEIVLSRDNVQAHYRRALMGFIDRLKVDVPRPGRLRVFYNNKTILDATVLSTKDLLIEHMITLLAFYVANSFRFFLTELFSSLLPDSRAGISRTLLRPYLPDLVRENLSRSDKYFIDLYHRLAEDIQKYLVDLDLIRPLLEELGCWPEVIFEGGIYPSLYVKMWTDKCLPFRLSPSGVREALIAALELASERRPYVIIEEPEAHLHPRAQRILARVIARVVNELGKTVILTTHSDYLLYSIENLIMLSKSHDKAKELGIDESEILDPDEVAVYLVKPEGKKATIERLEVTSDGIPEEEFTKVAEELSEERARILA